MNQISPQQLLDQIRTMNSEFQTTAPPAATPQGVPGFGEMLETAVNSVNETQKTAGALKRDFDAERSDVDLAHVMVAVQKADLSFRAMTEVRNKLVTAYQDIMNMPV